MRRNSSDEAYRILEREIGSTWVELVERDWREGPIADVGVLRLLEARRRYHVLRAEWLEAISRRDRASHERWRHEGDPVNPGSPNRHVDAILARGAVALRLAHPRIRRSRRTSFYELRAWAYEVLGRERADEIAAPFVEEARTLIEQQDAEFTAAKAAIHDLAVKTVALRGPEQLWRIDYCDHRREAYQIRRHIDEEIRFLEALGLKGRWEYFRGELRESHDHRGRPTTYRANERFVVYAEVEDKADVVWLDEIRERVRNLFFERLKQDQERRGQG